MMLEICFWMLSRADRRPGRRRYPILLHLRSPHCRVNEPGHKPTRHNQFTRSLALPSSRNRRPVSLRLWPVKTSPPGWWRREQCRGLPTAIGTRKSGKITVTNWRNFVRMALGSASEKEEHGLLFLGLAKAQEPERPGAAGQEVEWHRHSGNKRGQRWAMVFLLPPLRHTLTLCP